MSYTLKRSLALLPFMLVASPAHAADYDASVSGPINTSAAFINTDILFANISNAVTGGAQDFFSTSSLNATAANAVSGGDQTFFDISILNASTANAISGGTQIFFNTSSLNASTANAVSGGTQQFLNTSSLNASAADAVSGGTQDFTATSSLNASAANAVSGGTQNFFIDSILNATAANAISGGTQNFNDTSILNASVANVVSGVGIQNFNNSSILNASAANAISGGDQNFNNSSILNATAANAISGGAQLFFGSNILNASVANAVSGGTQMFFSTSILNATAANAVSSGVQFFDFNSSLNASAANAVSGGVQFFHNTSSLNASAANAVSGGVQEFNDFSILNASVTNAVSGGAQLFFTNSSLNVTAANAVSGGTQRFFGTSSLTVSGAGSISSNAVSIELFDVGTEFNLNDIDATLGALTGGGTVTNTSGNATLTIDTTVLGDSSFDGTLENASGAAALHLVKAGAGRWDFGGTTAGITGSSTTVAGGMLHVTAAGTLETDTAAVDSGAQLAVNGTFTTATLNVNGLLSGAGTVNAANLTFGAGGTLAPGNSIGTLTVNGNLTFAAGSSYDVEVDDTGASDLTNVNGDVTINNGATVNTIITPGNYTPGATINYDILTYTGTLTGTFSGTTTDLAFFTTTLDYSTPGTIFLNLLRNNTNFTDIGGSYNQMQAAGGLIPLAGGVMGAAVLGLDVAGARNAFSQLAGELHPSVQGALIDDTDFVRSSITDRLYKPNDSNVWFKGSSTHAYTDRNSNTDSTARHMNGGIMGTDRIIGASEQWTAGLFAGYGDTRFNTRSSSADIDSVHLGGYAGRSFDKVSLKLGTAYGYHRLDTERNLSFGSFSGRESAGYDAHTLQAFADIGYRIQNGQGSIEPFLNVAQVYTSREGFDERGNAAALDVDSEQSQVTLATIGLRIDQPLNITNTLPLHFNGSFGFRHAEGDVTPKSEAKLNGSTDFDIRGNPIARDALTYDIGLNSMITPAVNAGINYRGQHSDHNRSHAANVYLAWNF